MKTRLLKAALCGSTLFAVALLAAPVHADGIIDVTATTNNPVITEGDTGFLDLTVTNNGGLAVILTGFFVEIDSPTVGDPSDAISLLAFDNSASSCMLSSSLGIGSSCKFVFYLDTDSGAGETDADSGVAPGSADVTYDVAAIGEGYKADAPAFTITVNDLGVSKTPEPSSLLLLGSGLLGILGLGRKRLI